VLWICYGILFVASLFITFSALAPLAIRVDSTAGPIVNHLMFIIFGAMLIGMMQMASFPLLRFIGHIVIFVGFFGVLYVKAKGGGIGGASRHTAIGQPSELLLLGLILECASFFNRFAVDRSVEDRFYKWVFGAIIICIGLIMVDNLSTAILSLVVVVSMMVVSGIKLQRVGGFIGVLVVLFALIMIIPFAVPKPVFDQYAKEYKVVGTFRRTYTWKERGIRYAEEKFGKKEDKADNAKAKNEKEEKKNKYVIDPKNPQSADSKIAICRGGWYPHGPSSSHQRYHLAEAYSDYIFSIAAEELGFVISVLFMFVYVAVFWRSVQIACHEKKMYRILLITGCAVLIVTQAAVHIAVSVGAIPVTGQPLPLISKGGSSIIVISACFGIIAKISAAQKDDKESAKPAEPGKPEEEPGKPAEEPSKPEEEPAKDEEEIIIEQESAEGAT